MHPEGWANTSLRPGFFAFEPAMGASFLPAIFWFTTWTVLLSLALLVFFVVLHFRGLRFNSLLSLLRLYVGNLFRWPVRVGRSQYPHRNLDQP